MGMPADLDGSRGQADVRTLESVLRRAALAGDLSAWGVLHDQNFAGLDAHVRHLVAGDRDLADDVVQETWMVAVRRLKAFNPERAAFATWLRGVAGRLLVDHRRRIQRTGRGFHVDSSAPAAQPVAEVSQNLAAHVRATLLRLPRSHRAVLRAKYMESLTVGEIASALGRSPKAVESLLTRARIAFKSIFRREDGDR